MALVHLVYTSRPFGFDSTILNGILVTARRLNARDGITGALICRADLYVQMLEGPEEVLDACYGRIARDDRHVDVVERLRRPIAERMFPEWAMRDDPAHSWMWSQQEVENDAADHASADDYISIFKRLAAEPYPA